MLGRQATVETPSMEISLCVSEIHSFVVLGFSIGDNKYLRGFPLVWDLKEYWTVLTIDWRRDSISWYFNIFTLIQFGFT